jgi:hypothetical protein
MIEEIGDDGLLVVFLDCRRNESKILGKGFGHFQNSHELGRVSLQKRRAALKNT